MLLLVVGIYRTDFLPEKNVVYNSIYTISQLAYLISLFYLIELLKYVGERKIIVIGFCIFAALVFITSIIGFASFSPVIMMRLVTTINILVILSTIFLIIVSFMVKNPILAVPFRVLAIVQIFILIITFGVTLLLAHLAPAYYFHVSRYMHFGGLIITSAIAYIIYTSGRLLSTEISQPVQ
jgi:hypothetical protein